MGYRGGFGRGSRGTVLQARRLITAGLDRLPSPINLASAGLHFAVKTGVSPGEKLQSKTVT